MAILDDLYDSVYDRKTYNCAHFASDVWKRLVDKNDDRLARLAAIYTDGKLPHMSAYKNIVKDFKKVDRNERVALILCEPPFDRLHMGILWEGNMVHLTPGGVECFELSTYDGIYKNMRFYR